MLGRRKQPDGFEWHKYVRTSVRLRREERRQRILEARRAAAEQAGAAGVALVQGSRAAGAAAVDGARAGLGATWLLLQATLHIVWHLTVKFTLAAATGIAAVSRPVLALLARPNIGGPVALVGAIAVGLGLGRYRGSGLDGEAMLTLGAGILLLIATLPMLSSLTGIRMPRLPGLGGAGISPRALGLAAIVAAVVAGGAWYAYRGPAILAGLTGKLPLIGSSKTVKGPGEALSGDLLRVAGTTMRLAGIEAPEQQQTCGAGNRRQSCGAAAQAALARLVGGRSVSCTQSGSDSAGRPLVTCTQGKIDINGELVRQGHAFAAGSLFATYSGLEREARNAKVGIWAAGEVERPSEFRSKLWAEAKRRSPDGCPIKGRVTTGGSRIYVLPWSPDYDRGRIQKARGERWFCSEQEAEAAGFRPAVRG
jgi:endonuclease YncB( thermonuclease family)